MTSNNRFLAVTAVLALGVSNVACSGDDSSGDATGPGTFGETSGTDTATSTTASTSTSTSTSDGTTTAGSGSTTGPVEPQPNGAECEENEQCESGMCFVVSLLGGICGECLTDDDCPDGGCSIPNPISEPPQGATCNMGEPGQGCMSDAVCQDGYVCASIINVPGVLEASTCSECTSDADCTDGMLCSPTYDVLNISGQRVCVTPGSVENGQGCDLEGTGNEACMSGICYAADIMGIVMLGVCGECGVDADCLEGETCMEPNIDTNTGEVTPPMCGMP